MAELYSEADGYAFNLAFGGTWTTVRNGTSSSSVNNTRPFYQIAASGYILSGFFTLPTVSRTFIRFDCSGITSTLSEASLKIYGYVSANRGDDEDLYSKNIQKLSNDALIFTDTNRVVNYTLPPASISTGRNAMQFMRELSTFERFKRDSKFGDAGDLKAKGPLRKILQFQDVTEKLLEK